MSKHRQKKDPNKSQDPAKQRNPAAPARDVSKKIIQAPDLNSTIKKAAVFIFLLAAALYIQTVQYDFVFDDRLVTFENTLTAKGLSAIPDIFTQSFFAGSIVPEGSYMYYRPMSRVLFAICWQFFPNDPGAFHFVNVLFYALTGMILFLTLARFFPKRIYVPLIATLLFVVHPIHTEVVDNIKSLDEILCFFFFLVSLYFTHSYAQSKQIKYLVLAALGFFLSFLSKESGIVFLAVYPLVLYYLNSEKKEIITATATMLLVTALAFAIRWLVLGAIMSPEILETDNIIVTSDSFLEQRSTAIAMIGKYLLLLLFPHPLVCDYSVQQVSLVGAGDWRFLLSLLFLLGLAAYTIRGFLKRDWIAFGILFFFISFSVTSNIFYICGSHFAERFMYTPSLGLCLSAALVLDRFIENNAAEKPFSLKARPMLLAIVVIAAGSFSFKTIKQNPVWRNNVSLFENGVKYSPKSYRMHLSLAQDLTEAKYLQQFPEVVHAQIYERAIGEAKTSLRYYRDIDAYDMIGNIFYVTGRYDSSLYYYLEGLKYEPGYETLNHHAGKALDKLQRYAEAIPYLEKALAKNSKNDGALYNLALSYTNLNEIDKGLEYFLKVIELRPNGPDAYHYAGLIYRAKGDLAKADEYLKKAQALGGPRQ